ncbi:HNH endonuclease [Vibrio parahaemolyticus]|nr:HNH endonuclease [Vibrio parahaemolyticus]MDG2665820.1 HNH endonuclease [Vibrio parahaemolyticus]HDK8942015.1 HNH endonuclease [Vibrio parahaemolyticus]
MQIWRLVAHHEEAEKALEQMVNSGRIAIGWSDLDDLSEWQPSNSREISSKLREIRPIVTNSGAAGVCLWRFFKGMEIGDQVIVSANKKRRYVFEVTSPYFYDSENTIIGYAHQREVTLTMINPDALWHATSGVADGESVQWALAKCNGTKKSEEIIYTEGKRYSVTSTAIERDQAARSKCLAHYGYSCQVCSIDFEQVYGEIGSNYIHVHHRVDLASQTGEHNIDPIKDLIPLCPNCHAMVHTQKPAMSIEKLKSTYKAHHKPV